MQRVLQTKTGAGLLPVDDLQGLSFGISAKMQIAEALSLSSEERVPLLRSVLNNSTKAVNVITDLMAAEIYELPSTDLRQLRFGCTVLMRSSQLNTASLSRIEFALTSAGKLLSIELADPLDPSKPRTQFCPLQTEDQLISGNAFVDLIIGSLKKFKV